MPSKLVEKVTKLMEDQKGTCAQAIFTAFGEHLSDGKVDFDTSMKISSAFSGGVAGTGNICGALNGALMALGFKYGGSPMEQKANEVALTLFEEFKALHGSIMCRELIGQGLLTDEEKKKAWETGAFKNCPKYVEDVATILEKLI